MTTDWVPWLALLGAVLVGWCGGVLTFWVLFWRNR